jgi:hypothetical protein
VAGGVVWGVFAALWGRPGPIDGEPSASEPRIFKVMRPVLRVLRPFRALSVKGEEIGRAMLQATREGMRGRIVENREIRDLADRAGA